jgi:hypothetical protein
VTIIGNVTPIIRHRLSRMHVIALRRKEIKKMDETVREEERKTA